MSDERKLELMTYLKEQAEKPEVKCMMNIFVILEMLENIMNEVVKSKEEVDSMLKGYATAYQSM